MPPRGMSTRAGSAAVVRSLTADTPVPHSASTVARARTTAERQERLSLLAASPVVPALPALTAAERAALDDQLLGMSARPYPLSLERRAGCWRSPSWRRAAPGWWYAWRGG